MKIKLQNREIEYTLRRSRRAGRMRLAVYGDGRVTLTLPRGISKRTGENFIREKSAWLIRKIAYFEKYGMAKHGADNGKDYLKRKKEAYEFIRERLEHFNRIYGYKYNRITVKRQKTRWGSCSEKGNLNYNYRIIDLPGYMADYIIIHELCHLKEMNHSPKFWDLVSRTVPDYRNIRKKLRKEGLSLL